MTRKVTTAGLIALALVLGRPAHATTALPEVLLVIDNSSSMQFRVGGDTLPLCGSADPSIPDERSRWNTVREIVGGSFASFTCKYEALPVSSEVASPPKQFAGAPQCIPGLGAAIGVNYTAGGPTDADMMAATATWAGVNSAVGDAVLMDGTTPPTVSVPWLRFNLAKVLAAQKIDQLDKEPWASASVTLNTLPASSVTANFYAALVLLTDDPSTANGHQVACAADIVGRVAVSNAAPVVVGQQTVFALTDSGIKALRDLANAGQTYASLAIVPVSSILDASCTAVSGTASDSKVVWAGATGSDRPRLDVVVGMQCPDEGPGQHSVAYAIQNDGLPDSKSTGMDGILDAFGPVAKFALLTADGMLGQASTAQGGFSFAAAQPSIWGDINLGIADPYASGTTSVPVTGPDTLLARQTSYGAIQAALQGMRPNGPTALGDQLADVYEYLLSPTYQDPHFRPVDVDPINGDPLLACRKKVVVVLSDGGANLRNGTTDGRDWAVQQAGRLYAKGVPVYVLAVGHPSDELAPGPSPADMQFLNDVAIAGGTLEATPIATPQAAVSLLTPVIAETALVGEVLTREVHSTATGLVGEVEHSFHALSVFDISQPLRTRGTLEQAVFKCTPECKAALTPNRAQVCKILDYQKQMLERTIARRLYSHLSGARIDADSAHLSAGNLGIGTVGIGPKLSLQADSSCTTAAGYNLSLPDERNAYRDHVLDTLRGAVGTCRQNWPLGAPARSQPSVLETASRMPLRDPSYLTYAATTVPTKGQYSDVQPPGSAGRPTMLFTATHDGLLHAFRTDANPQITVKDGLVQGDEMWAWLPRFNQTRISQMKLVTTAAASNLGGSIAARHVLLHRSSATAADVAKQWRAVVVVGAGEAGAGYTALDVTAADDPQLLWEITPEYHCYGSGVVYNTPGPQCVPTATFQALGRSTARASIVSLFYALPGDPPAEHAVAVIPMGMAPGEATVANLGVEGVGERGVFIVDMATGALIKAFKTADLVLTGMPNLPSDPTVLGHAWSDISCFNSAPGQIATRCFQGDSKGMLWRLDLAAKDPANWKMQFFFDAYAGVNAPVSLQLAIDSPNRAPIVSPPALAMTHDGRLNIVFGTGGPDQDASTTRHHLAYSLTEAFTLKGDGSSVEPTAERNWVKTLQDNERFVGPPLIFGFNAYWSSYTAVKSGACDIGSARLWGGHFDRPATVGDVTHLQGAFAVPGELKNLEFIELGPYKPSPVDVLAVPACSGSCSPTDAKCVAAMGKGALGAERPQYQLGVQVAANVQGQYQKPKSGMQPQIGTITKEIAQPRTTAMVTGWDLLLD